MNDELTSRATEYLKDKQITETFVMSGESITLVEKEALHQWAKTRVGYPLPYDQLRRLCLQLQERADEQQWTLQVGGGWNIIRNGITLTALRDGMVSDDQEIIERELDWSLVENGGDNPVDNIDKALLIQMPGLYSSMARESHGTARLFTGTKGSAASPWVCSCHARQAPSQG